MYTFGINKADNYIIFLTFHFSIQTIMDTRFEQICTFGAFAHTPDVNTTAYEYTISPCLAEKAKEK